MGSSISKNEEAAASVASLCPISSDLLEQQVQDERPGKVYMFMKLCYCFAAKFLMLRNTVLFMSLTSSARSQHRMSGKLIPCELFTFFSTLFLSSSPTCITGFVRVPSISRQETGSVRCKQKHNSSLKYCQKTFIFRALFVPVWVQQFLVNTGGKTQLCTAHQCNLQLGLLPRLGNISPNRLYSRKKKKSYLDFSFIYKKVTQN